MSNATTIAEYLAHVPEPRRPAIEAVRDVILKNLPEGYVEVIAFGMIAYEVPLRVYPDTYNRKPLMYAALASQKNHMAVYLCNVYADSVLAKELAKGFLDAGKKLDMGASCVRFKRLEDLALDVIGKTVAATPMSTFVELARRAHSKEAKAERKAARSKP